MSNSQSMMVTTELSGIQKAARAFIMEQLKSLRWGKLSVVEVFGPQAEQFNFGQSDAEVVGVVEVQTPDFYLRMLKGGSIAAARAYIDGDWESPNLVAVMQVMAKNTAKLDHINGRMGVFTRFANLIGHWKNRNTQRNAKQNILAHYDLGNSLYERFLDNEMLYSSALYLNKDDSLEQAQQNKMQRLCEQLQLQASDRVIEIGTGWGGMAIYMAKNFGCHVTTTTISDEQFDYAQQRIEQEGLQHKITLLKKDYRLLEGTFDKLVSIEMIEAVGRAFLASYIDKCNALVKPGGRVAIQSITIADQRFESYSNSVDFIQKYIFPGGFLPSVSYLLEQTTKHSQLVIEDLYDIGIDYAYTLREWRERFNHADRELSELGFDDRFKRMWRYYLCYCEGGFLARSISTVHLTFRKS
ncbi:SAM-dependent methyltransferase [Vibrio gallicus]|uniref:SAM-dependent methyltransferase n=1 Tax=Vibrio gallicus TaxID=190897 RepID=UPI0021C32CD8|nr:cyclopropane-fatty-acyl-phospholipid synthase family protein [Vibrio gallicus]